MIEILAIVLLIFVLIPMALAAKSFAPWIPTDARDLDRIFKVINLKPGEILYEPGCGDGRIVFYANKKYGNRAVGIEMAFPQFLFARIRQIFNPGVNIVFGDLFKTDFSKADVVYVFGMPDVISTKLRVKFEKELKKDSRVICYNFPIEGWTPALVDQPSPQKHPIFLYRR